MASSVSTFIITFNGSTLQSVIFDLSYNILYNVTVQVEPLCGNNVIIFANLLLYFCKFYSIKFSV